MLRIIFLILADTPEPGAPEPLPIGELKFVVSPNEVKIENRHIGLFSIGIRRALEELQ